SLPLQRFKNAFVEKRGLFYLKEQGTRNFEQGTISSPGSNFEIQHSLFPAHYSRLSYSKAFDKSEGFFF
ncbi:MAG TPA: hypothetical protein PKY28_07610, partial [Ferruginibacter sp.]|nr:hypothetical protein [Ferruginibacter sp.]